MTGAGAMHTFFLEEEADDWLEHFLPGPDPPPHMRFRSVSIKLSESETPEWEMNLEIVRNPFGSHETHPLTARARLSSDRVS